MKNYLRPEAAAKYLNISRATLYRWAKLYTDFPKPYKIGDRTSVWDLAELENYVQNRQAVT